MPVERDIDLNKPLSTEDINYLEEEANRLEELAKEAQEDAKKAKEFQKEEERILNDAVNKVEKIEKEADKAEKAKKKIGKSIKEVNELAENRSGLAGMGGDDPFIQQGGMGGMGAGTGQIKAGRTGFGTGQERSPLGLIPGEQRMRELERLADLKLAKEERAKLSKIQKEHAEKLAKQRKLISTVQKGEQDFFAMSRNPLGFGMGKMTGLLMKGGIYGIIALAVISMAQQIFEEVKKLYAPGGPFDIRKQMMDRDRELIELDHLLDRRGGRVFFTADTDLVQGSPEINSGSTNRIVQQTLRYQALHHDE